MGAARTEVPFRITGRNFEHWEDTDLRPPIVWLSREEAIFHAEFQIARPEYCAHAIRSAEGKRRD